MTRTPAPKACELDDVPPHAAREAKKLLETAGSPELAKQAANSAAGHPAAPTPANDTFAKRWSFASYLELFEASKSLGESEGKHWLVTNVGPEEWIVWNEQELRVVHTCKSLEEAKHQLRVRSAKPPGAADAPPQG